MTAHPDPSRFETRCLIGGEWEGEPDLAVLDPSTGDTVARVPNGGEAEATRAVEAAAAALPAWSATAAQGRAAVLRRWHALIIDNTDALAHLIASEGGKPVGEARGEIAYAASFVAYYAEEILRPGGETVPSHVPGARIVVSRHPIGVVAAITPWNFPAAMITRKIAPAVAAGCTAVVKPAPETPLTALALGQLALEAGLPPGVLNIVTGEAEAIGGVLTSHPAVRAISFTGSTAVGKLLMRQASQTVKRVALELGGNAPFIVFDDADLDAAVDGAMATKFRNMGQTCVCANRFYVQAGLYDAFCERLAARADALRVGLAREEGVTQGPLITQAAVEKVSAHVADAVSNGAEVLAGGGAHELGGTFYRPTVLRGVTPQMALAREETFGPVAGVIRFDSEAEAIEQANATEYGLAAYLYTRDLGRAWRMSDALEFGMVGVNAVALGAPAVPFGGVKQSGLGREGGPHGLEEYLEIKYTLMGGLSAPD